MDEPEREDDAGILTHEDIEALVRFHDPQKGFGFVQVTDGSPDAFLARSVLERGGFPDVQAGDIVFCSIVAGRRDPKVHEVHHVDRNPFGRPSGFPSAIRGGHGGEAKLTRTDEPPRRWTRPPR